MPNKAVFQAVRRGSGHFLGLLLCAALAACQGGQNTQPPPPPPNSPPHPYTTRFPKTENPISEGGYWINGGTVGLAWTNARTTPGFAFGTMVGTDAAPQSFADSTAVLAGTWNPNQAVTITVAAPSPSSANGVYEEVEIRLRTAITANSITGYEINCSVSTDPTNGNYLQLIRWNGALGDFTQLDAIVTHCVSGDVLKASISGSSISVYLNNMSTPVMSWGDSTYSTGNPGLGFFLQGATGLDANYGISSFTASD